jgi:RNA polymerase sigma-70 factor (ECF subfamily)
VTALAPRSSDAREVVAEALIRLRGALERMCRRRFPSLDAGDVYQRASLRALERCESVRDRDRVDGWVRRIVVTSALDLLCERRGETTLSEEHDTEVPAPQDEVCACTLALMKSLPESYGDIIHRVDIDGAGLAEVAERLKIATGNAAVRLHRARRALRNRLREHCGVETMRQCLSCACNERGRCGPPS